MVSTVGSLSPAVQPLTATFVLAAFKASGNVQSLTDPVTLVVVTVIVAARAEPAKQITAKNDATTALAPKVKIRPLMTNDFSLFNVSFYFMFRALNNLYIDNYISSKE
jgi:hypothetical protein